MGIGSIVSGGYAAAEEGEFDVDARLLHAPTDQRLFRMRQVISLGVMFTIFDVIQVLVTNGRIETYTTMM